MPDDLPELEEQTRSALATLVREAPGRLVVLFSGGKDSVVLLHLTRTLGTALPVITYREPWWPRKWAFATDVARLWDLEVHHPPPARTWTYQRGEQFVLGSSYDLGGGQHIDIPKDVIEWQHGGPPPPGGAVCSLDYLTQPVGTWQPRWDLALCGHKDADLDPVLGAVPLKTDRLRTPDGAMDIAFPLRHWTDDHVWEYTRRHKLPVDLRRYDRDAGRHLEDKTHNTDYIPACARCVRAEEGETVPCPKLNGAPVPGCAGKMPRLDRLDRPYFHAARPEPSPAQ